MNWRFALLAAITLSVPCFCRFEAATADDARDANEVAGAPFARIVAGEELGIDTTRPNTKGDES